MTQTIRRAARRHRFVIVDQAAVEDARLSWAARGLLAYLLSRPDDWKVLVNDLKKRGNLGRDGIYALLRELRSAGYVCFERNRDAQAGRFRSLGPTGKRRSARPGRNERPIAHGADRNPLRGFPCGNCTSCLTFRFTCKRKPLSG